MFETGSEGFPREDEAFSHGLLVGGGTMNGSHCFLYAWGKEQAIANHIYRYVKGPGKWALVPVAWLQIFFWR